MENYKIGISTSLFHQWPIEKIYQPLFDSSFQYFELWAHSHLKLDDQIAAKTVVDNFRNSGKQVSSIHAPIFTDISSSNNITKQAAIDSLQRTIEIADFCQVPQIIAHPGGDKSLSLSAVEDAGAVERTVLAVERITALDKPSNLVILIENMPPSMVGTIEELLAATTRLGGLGFFKKFNIGFCLDLSHANIEDPQLDLFDSLPSNIVNELHISDNNGSYDEHLIPGQGKFNWPKFFQSGCFNHNAIHILELIFSGDEPTLFLNQAYNTYLNMIDRRGDNSSELAFQNI